MQRFAELLSKEFRFADVDTLAGNDGADRPTAAAIAARFEALIARTRPHDQVVILLSGHGTQMPVPESQADLLDPSNPEPDGFDEVFLAADYSNGSNFIRDDQIGIWLDELRRKPADVWIVFDCCFSGTMTRGSSEPVSGVRGVHPVDAGIPEAVLKETAARARKSNLSQARSATPVAVKSSSSGQSGALVAFYACQPFETAKEVYRPEDVERVDEHRTGLLSHHLLRSLRRTGEEISYRDLARMVVAGIRAEMGSRGPTPLFEGNLDQRILGIEQWPQATMYLERVDGSLRVSGGTLSGLAAGTVLSVHELGKSESGDPLGYVQVSEASITESRVTAIAHAGIQELSVSDQKLPLRCKVVSGTTVSRTKIGTVPLSDEDETLTSLVNELQQKASDRIVVTDTTTAEYLISHVNPASAFRRFMYSTERPGYLLLERQAARPDSPDVGRSNNVDELVPLSFIEADKLSDSVKSQLLTDLQRIRTWQMLWNVASTFGENSPSGRRSRLSLRVVEAAGGNQELTMSDVRPGTKLEIHLENRRFVPVWYTVFFMNAKYGIEFVKAGTIRARRAVGEESASVVVERMQVNQETLGVEGYIALGVPLKDNRAEPNFRFLAQPEVGAPNVKSSAKVPTQPTLFETVLIEAAQGGTSVRSGVSTDGAEMSSFSWVTVGDDL
ncbi:MAG: hypothetical protein Fues2KO_50290 [Fuerstiella sp.]